MMAILEGTKSKALRVAQDLLQARGFNGFSFQHIADELGIKKPSLYDHFKSKEVLANELVEAYHSSFLKWTETVKGFKPEDQIGALFEIFYFFSKKDLKYCPISAFAADFNTLPKSVQKSTKKMMLAQKTWLISVIEAGQDTKTFRKDLSAPTLADLLMTLAIGSQFLSRMNNDPEKIQSIKKQAITLLTERKN